MFRYISLTKPRIILLLAFTGVVGYLVPSLDNVAIIDVIIFVLAGYAASGGAMTINNVIDRDIDIKMQRTNNRNSVGIDALPAGNMIIFGTLLSLFGIMLGLFYFGPFTAFHLAWGALFYIFGYSIFLKKRSVVNTFIGGLASPSPVWVGFAARYENLSIHGDTFLGVPLTGWLLGGIVFFWSASHTFALSAIHVEDYAQANIPMLPVVLGMERASKVTFVWGIALIIYATIVAVILSETYLILGIIMIPHIFLFRGLWKFFKKPNPKTAKACFMAHNIWLPILFIAIIVLSLV